MQLRVEAANAITFHSPEVYRGLSEYWSFE